eukprot:6174323-Pleurochrysis_carterae.AAC.1
MAQSVRFTTQKIGEAWKVEVEVENKRWSATIRVREPNECDMAHAGVHRLTIRPAKAMLI